MKFKELKEKWQGKNLKTIAFFVFYFFFFAFVLIVYLNGSDTDKIDTKNINSLESIINNYEYSYSITKIDTFFVNISGKKYNNKSLFTINKTNAKAVDVYKFYDEISIKNDTKWETVSNYALVDEEFNENLLEISRLKVIISDAELINTTTNFDGTKSESYVFSNIKIEVISESNVLKKIVIRYDNYDINLQYKNINRVKDFVVEK